MTVQIASRQISIDESRSVRFREARPEDESFLFSLYAATRSDEMALTGWDETQQDVFLRMQFSAQKLHYRTHYPEGEHLIVLAGDEALGRLYFADTGEEIRILDMTLLPERRNGGIGTPIIKQLMAEAAQIEKPLRIYVESFNPSQRLFERLGFVKAGENGHNYLLEWRANP